MVSALYKITTFIVANINNALLNYAVVNYALLTTVCNYFNLLLNYAAMQWNKYAFPNSQSTMYILSASWM